MIYHRFNWDETRCDMFVIRLILEPFATLVSIVIMPFMYIQFFSTYAWICVTGGKYCDYDAVESQLQYDKDIILLTFFLCISFLKVYHEMTPQKANDRLNCLKPWQKNRRATSSKFYI